MAHNVGYNRPNGDLTLGHSCALGYLGGVDCWGFNDVSQLGDGAVGTTESEYQRDYAVPVVAGPRSIDALTGVTAIAAGGYFTCALLDGGSVKCWGLGYSGDSLEGVGAPLPLAVPGGPVVAIAAGGQTFCALLASGTLLCPGISSALDPMPGLTIAAAAPSPSPSTTAPPVTTDPLGIVGEARLYYAYSSPIAVHISWDAGSGYSVSYTAPVQWVSGSACTLPAGTLALTFGGPPAPGGEWSGEVLQWTGVAGSDTCEPEAPFVITNVEELDGGQSLQITTDDGSSLGGRVFLDFTNSNPSPAPETSPTPTASPQRSATPTPQPTASPIPMTTDVDGLAGDWTTGPTPVTISFAGGEYVVANQAAMHIVGFGCDLPSKSVLGTFTGTGGTYSGQSATWNTHDCTPDGWTPMAVRLEGNRLVADLSTGGQQVFTRAVAGAVPFRASVPTLSKVNLDPIILLQSVAIAVGFALFIPFPGALFDNTLEANYEEVIGWGRSARRRLTAPFRRRPAATPIDDQESEPNKASDEWRSPARLAIALLLGVLLGCFLDPTFGITIVSAGTFIGVLAGVLLTMFVFALPRLTAYRANQRNTASTAGEDGSAADAHGWDPYVRALPAALIIAIGCVLVSRLTNFQPGYLYGLIIGVTAAHQLSDAQSARSAAIATVVMLVFALVAWLAYGWVANRTQSAGGPELIFVVLQTFLVTVMVAGLQGALLGLLPMRFFAGGKMIKWNKWVWGALLVVSGFAFWHVLVNPTSGYLADSSRTPLVTIVGLLIFFSLGSVAFWAYFRFRRRPAEAPAPG